MALNERRVNELITMTRADLTGENEGAAGCGLTGRKCKS
jgi:hypothetical protein